MTPEEFQAIEAENEIIRNEISRELYALLVKVYDFCEKKGFPYPRFSTNSLSNYFDTLALYWFENSINTVMIEMHLEGDAECFTNKGDCFRFRWDTLLTS